MFELNRRNLPESCDEGSVCEPSVLFTPTPEGYTELQSRFVDAFVQLGGKGELAAIEAGYSHITAGNMAVRNLSQPKIVALLNERLKAQGPTALAIAIGGLLRIIEHSKDDKAVVQASVALCDRFGLSVPRGPAVQVNVNTAAASDVAQALLAEVAAARTERLAREERAARIESEPAPSVGHSVYNGRQEAPPMKLAKQTPFAPPSSPIFD